MLPHTVVYLAIRATNAALALVSLFVLTRILEPAQYGVYALGLATMNVAASVLFQWLNVAVARFYAAHCLEPEDLLSEARRLFYRIGIVALLGTAAWALIRPSTAGSPALTMIVGGGAVAMGLHNLHIQIANAQGKPLRYGLITATRAATALLFSVALITAGFGSAGAVASVAVACVLAVALFGARWNGLASRGSPALRRQLVTYGVPLALTYASTMVLDVSDRFLIGWWHGPSAVAGYAAAYDLSQQTVGAALNVFFLVAYPRITTAWESGGVSAARQAMAPLARAMLLTAPLVAGLFIGMAPEIARLMFGVGLRSSAAQVMPWIAGAIAIGCLKGYMLDVAFHLSKATLLQLRITASMAAINVALNLVLIPALGTLGAAISTAIAFSIGAMLSWWHGRRVAVYPSMGIDVVKAVGTLATMAVVLRITAPTREPVNLSSDVVAVAIHCGIGLIAFGTTALVTNLSGVRSWVARRYRALMETTS